MIVLYTIKGVVVVTYQYQHVEQSMDSDVIVSKTTFISYAHTEYDFIPITDPGECTDGEVRLVDGVIEQEGRPEVCINGVWGSICHSSWSAIDGYVFCNSLGYDGPSMSCILQSTDTIH